MTTHFKMTLNVLHKRMQSGCAASLVFSATAKYPVSCGDFILAKASQGVRSVLSADSQSSLYALDTVSSDRQLDPASLKAEPTEDMLGFLPVQSFKSTPF